MYLEKKCNRKGTNKIFRSKQEIGKVPLLLLEVKMHKLRYGRNF